MEWAIGRRSAARLFTAPAKTLAVRAPASIESGVEASFDRVGVWCYSIALHELGDPDRAAAVVEDAYVWLARIAPTLRPSADHDRLVKLRLLARLRSGDHRPRGMLGAE